MNKDLYKSPFSNFIVRFLERRESLGFKIDCDVYNLSAFDRFLRENHFNDNCMFDSIWFEKWLKSIETQKVATRVSKISSVRRLLYYISSLGIPVYVPIIGKIKRERELKYIFTPDEIQKLFKAADSLRARQCHRTSILMIIPPLIRLMYSTAARISEALSIKIGDILWDRKLIILGETKNGDERILPMKDSLAEVLKQFLKYRNMSKFASVEDDAYLFISADGRPCIRRTVMDWFNLVLGIAGISKRERYTGPSLHSLRYSACVHAFKKLAQQGVDVYAVLPLISVFMGHKNVSDTEYYLRLTLDMYPDLLEKSSSICVNITQTIRRAALDLDIDN